MPIVRKLVVMALAALIAAPSATFAQQRHVIDPAAVAASVAQHAAEQDANRAAVREALTQPQVREMAGRVGLDIHRAAAAIDTLNASDLERAANAARERTAEEFVAADLTEARGLLEEMTGARTPGDVLEEIFSKFCIGK